MPVCLGYAGYHFPAEVISHAVWLYFRFPLSLRMVEKMLVARGIILSHETVRQWALNGASRAACLHVSFAARRLLRCFPVSKNILENY